MKDRNKKGVKTLKKEKEKEKKKNTFYKNERQ